MAMVSVGTPVLWIGFLVFVLLMLALDLGVFHKNPHEITLKEAGIWSAVWVTLSLTFNALVFKFIGPEQGLQFSAGYLLEKALSVDNIFVFVVIFTTLKVAPTNQHRVLFWGVLGALLLRAVFIGLGTALVQSFHWVMYVFGAILVFTAGKLLFGGEEESDPADSRLFKAFRRLVPSTTDYRGDRFFVTENGKCSSPSTRFPRCSPYRKTRSSSLPRTSSPSWGYVRCTSCSRAWCTSSTT
jgi:tellurite resistance protein TerC